MIAPRCFATVLFLFYLCLVLVHGFYAVLNSFLTVVENFGAVWTRIRGVEGEGGKLQSKPCSPEHPRVYELMAFLNG